VRLRLPVWPYLERRDICGIVMAAVAVLLAVVLSASYGRFIGSHVTNPDWPCSYGPKGTICSLTSFPLGHPPAPSKS
jgi:hypothetical protein